MTQTYDAIVVGLGAMGSAATYQLAKRGAKVLGLEQFQPGHDQGSSHGSHRMIRKSAIHDDGYVPLAARTFELWDEMEQVSGKELLRHIGEVTLAGGDFATRYSGVAERMQAEGFWELLDESGLRELYPGFQLYDGMQAIYERDAGFLWSERGIITHCEQAQEHGADIQVLEKFSGWQADGDGIRVTTAAGDYLADKLILTVGAWAPQVFADLQLPYRVIRSVNGYFEPTKPEYWTVEAGAPDFLLYVDEGSFYGIPSIDGIGVKIGRSATEWGTETTADTIRRTIDDGEIDMMRQALERYMPGAAGAELKRITCMDCYTVDDGFIVDWHPENENVLMGCGFSGKGFKFGPVIGEILADLALTGETQQDIGFISAKRFLKG